MQTLRRRLARVAGAVLSFHLCLLAAVPASLYRELRTATADCTCPGDDGGACPMHHKITSANPPETCAFRSAADPRAGLLAVLLGHVAVLPSVVEVERPMPVASVALPASQSLDTVSTPDSPPPRG